MAAVPFKGVTGVNIRKSTPGWGLFEQFTELIGGANAELMIKPDYHV
jgi:hypothetical protein